MSGSPTNDLERRMAFCVIPPDSVAFGALYVKIVEDTPVLSATEI